LQCLRFSVPLNGQKIELGNEISPETGIYRIGDEYYHLVALVRSTHIPQFYQVKFMGPKWRNG